MADYQYSGSIGVTEAGVVLYFDDIITGDRFRPTSITVQNDGSDDVLVTWVKPEANAYGWPIKNGESTGIGRRDNLAEPGWEGIGLICASGETCTVRVLAVRCA